MPNNPAGVPRAEVLEPRDLLVHMREWLNRYLQTNVKHFGDSDQSGHPHGYAGVVIPDWDVKQRLDEIQGSLDLGFQFAPNKHLPDGPQMIAWDERQPDRAPAPERWSVASNAGLTNFVLENGHFKFKLDDAKEARRIVDLLNAGVRRNV